MHRQRADRLDRFAGDNVAEVIEEEYAAETVGISKRAGQEND
jgi:hypothetical protein